MVPHHRAVYGLFLVSLAACNGDDEAPKVPPDTAETTGDTATETPTSTLDCSSSLATWDNVAKPFLDTWCTPCHSSALDEAARLGAPVGIDFDTWELAAPWAAQIRASALGDAPRMPPTGGTSDDERARMDEWISCGAPGPASVDDPCDSPVSGTSADPCADGITALIGDLTVTAASPDLSCLCAVDGAVAIDSGLGAFDRLRTIGGDLVIRSEATGLTAPALTTIGGELQIGAPGTGAAGLTLWSTPQLLSVGGSLRAEGPAPLGRWVVERLTSVGGDIVVDGVIGLTDLQLQRVETVGGAYRVTNNPDLAIADFFYELDAVGGDVVITGNPQLTSLVFATYLTSLGGGIEVGGNGLTQLSLFHDLTAIPGSVYIHDELRLTNIEGLEDVASIGGDLRLERLKDYDAGPDMDALTTIGGDARFIGLDRFDGDEQAGAVVTIDGDVEVSDCPRLAVVPWTEPLTRIGGDLVLRDSGLPTLAFWRDLERVDGDVLVQDLDALTAIDKWDSLDEVGELRIEGNDALIAVALERLTKARDVRIANLPLGQTLRLGRAGIRGDLTLEALGAYTNLTPLHDLDGVSGDVRIVNNPMLTTAAIDAFVAAVPPGGALTSYGNAP